MINEKTYRIYLIDLKDDVFKVLPLYEEKSETFIEYLDSLLFELYGLEFVIEGLPHGIWYVKTLSILEEIFHLEMDWENHKRVKKEVFSLLRLIDKQINQLKGE
jgi:hypothetical protein